MNIPVIDVSPLFNDDQEGWRRVEGALYAAHSTVGFSILVNHGVPGEIIDDLFVASEHFHAMSIEEKMLFRYGTHLRGYLPINTSTLTSSTLGPARKPNCSESFIILDELDDALRARWSDSAMGGQQIWPTSSKQFATAARRYRDAMCRLGEIMIRCFARIMGLPRHGLDRYFEVPNPILRLLHYPALRNRTPDHFGSAPHTDYGCLTFVAQDAVGGLQVLDDDGVWVDVPPIKHALVLNTGQIMATWSRGVIKATPHRVINHPGRSRYSIAFFFDCGLNTRVAPLIPAFRAHDGVWSEKIYGEHLESILRANYAFSA